MRTLVWTSGCNKLSFGQKHPVAKLNFLLPPQWAPSVAPRCQSAFKPQNPSSHSSRSSIHCHNVPRSRKFATARLSSPPCPESTIGARKGWRRNGGRQSAPRLPGMWCPLGTDETSVHIPHCLIPRATTCNAPVVRVFKSRVVRRQPRKKLEQVTS